MFGRQGTILHIDLTTRGHYVEKPDESILRRFIGGRGLAGWYLRPFVTRAWDDPSMPLLFFTGPLVDTPSPTATHLVVMSRSPQTGTIGDFSVGGALGPAIKRAGYDGIVITGRCDFLCGIEIENETVTITDAAKLKGAAAERARAISNEKGASAFIGPAAENGVRFAGIIMD
ncbi:MAG: aldehyde ferredoxin oxidoreductase, partial [Chitinivibrionales bacterium]|nr:aldehyde ferredoxin oxidoreductase [Chitinivibrionales bacterium]MBD3357143.1 aldehyde ferredoxin oxidoreductase [Chitinivibrionales bacterium]